MWPQGLNDDGRDDDTVLEWDSPNEDGYFTNPPPPDHGVLHRWIPFEPHTTSYQN